MIRYLRDAALWWVALVLGLGIVEYFDPPRFSLAYVLAWAFCLWPALGFARSHKPEIYLPIVMGWHLLLGVAGFILLALARAVLR